MSDGLAAVTVTPGSTAALVSATLPLIEPVVLAPPPCANACVDASRQAASIATTRTNPRRFMNALLILKSLKRAQCSRTLFNAVRFSDSGNATGRQTPCSTAEAGELSTEPPRGQSFRGLDQNCEGGRNGPDSRFWSSRIRT